MSSNDTRQPHWLERRAQARATLVDTGAVERQHGKAVDVGAARGAWLNALTSRAASDAGGPAAPGLPLTLALPSSADTNARDGDASDASGVSNATGRPVARDASPPPAVSAAAARHAQRLLSPGRIDVRSPLTGVASAHDARQTFVQRLASRAAPLDPSSGAPSSGARVASEIPVRITGSAPAMAALAERHSAPSAAPRAAVPAGSPSGASAPSNGKPGATLAAPKDAIPAVVPPASSRATASAASEVSGPRSVVLPSAAALQSPPLRGTAAAPRPGPAGSRDVFRSPAPPSPRASEASSSGSTLASPPLAASRAIARTLPAAGEAVRADASNGHDRSAAASPPPPLVIARAPLPSIPPAPSPTPASPPRLARALGASARDDSASAPSPEAVPAPLPLASAFPSPGKDRVDRGTAVAHALAAHDGGPARAPALVLRASGSQNGAPSASARALVQRAPAPQGDAAGDAPAAAPSAAAAPAPAPAAPAAAPGPSVDVGALAQQVTRLIVRQFEIERERRGGGRWW